MAQRLIILPARGIDDVFRDVSSGRCDYGIVPVENSTEGGIRETLNMFVEFDVKVCAEIVFINPPQLDGDLCEGGD